MDRRLPLVTFALIVSNVTVYLIGPRATTQDLPAGVPAECARAAFAQRYGAVPWELTHNQVLSLDAVASAGGRAARCPMPDFDKSPALSALTSMFVHAGAAHLIGNLLLLLLVGWTVERRLGSAGFAVFYLVCGYTAAYGFAFSVPSDTRPLIGASGAIAGVLAAHVWLRPKDLVIPLLSLPLLLPIPGPSWLVGQAAGDVAYTAHLVGLAVGFVLAALWIGGSTERTGPRATDRSAPGLANSAIP